METKSSSTGFVLSIDVGTTSIRAHIFDKKATLVANESEGIPLIFPEPHHIEQDPNLLWTQCLSVIRRATKSKNISPSDIQAIGITCQRNSFVTWNKTTGEPLHNIITWQDGRSAQHCERANKSLTVNAIRTLCKTAYGVSGNSHMGAASTFSFSSVQAISGLSYMLKTNPQVKKLQEEDNLYFGTLDTWLIYNLTGKRAHVTDYSMISSTGFWDPFTMTWNGVALYLMGIPKNILPTVVDTSGFIAMCDPSVFGEENKVEVPITAICADQHAALFGECCFEAGDIKVTIGTGCFVDLNTGNKPKSSKSALWPLVAWKIGDETRFLAEGAISQAGSAVEWAVSVGMASSVAETSDLANSVEDANGIYFVPALSGLNQPWNNDFARGAMIGLTRSTTRQHMVRSVLEGIAYRIKDIVKAIEEDFSDISIKCIKSDGGASKNDFLLQFASNLLQYSVDRAEQSEMTSQGVAFLAGLAVKFWESKEELKKLRTSGKVFEPEQVSNKEAKQNFKKWQTAVKGTLDWAKPVNN